jgi:hypothetical protein
MREYNALSPKKKLASGKLVVEIKGDLHEFEATETGNKGSSSLSIQRGTK